MHRVGGAHRARPARRECLGAPLSACDQHNLRARPRLRRRTHGGRCTTGTKDDESQLTQRPSRRQQCLDGPHEAQHIGILALQPAIRADAKRVHGSRELGGGRTAAQRRNGRLVRHGDVARGPRTPEPFERCFKARRSDVEQLIAQRNAEGVQRSLLKHR